jgi:predicted amidophosphoribosyltransferase
MTDAMMTATGIRVVDQPERCDACGKYRPFQSGLCWQCKDAIAKYEAEFLRLAIDELMIQLASDSGKADE